MHHLNAIASAGRHVSKIAFLGTISSVVAAAATTWLVTGSTDPNVWVADYKHALQCAVADPALSSSCYTVAAVPAVAVQAPERSAAEQSPPSAEPPAADPTTVPPAAPQRPTPPRTAPAAAYEPEDGDSGESDS